MASDEFEVWQLTTRYALALDERDWEGLKNVFTKDAVMDFAAYGEVEGPDGIAQTCAAALAPLDLSQHMVGSHRIAVDGDTASCTCHFVARAVRESTDGGPLFTLGGTYVDRMGRTSEGWRIERRDQVISWTSGNPGVMEK